MEARDMGWGPRGPHHEGGRPHGREEGRRGGPHEAGRGDRHDGGHGEGRHGGHHGHGDWHRGGPPFGERGRGFGSGPHVGRGDVRAATLALLAEGPRNGYQIIQQIGERSGGVWRPSPGSVYPGLQQLEDEGLIRAEEADGRRVFALTDAGRQHVEGHQGELAGVWAAVTGSVDTTARELRGLFEQVGAAVAQVARAGEAAEVAEARRLLIETRRRLYRILAGPDGEEPPDAGGAR